MSADTMYFEDTPAQDDGQKWRLILGKRAEWTVLVFMEDGSFWPKGWLGSRNLPEQLKEKRNTLVKILLAGV